MGHVGFYRNEKLLQPIKYYFKMPKNSQTAHCFVCDPMLATGGTAIAAIQSQRLWRERHYFLCVVAAPEGLEKTLKAHPDVPIYTTSLDRQLNDVGYILPGLGDAGDRLWDVSKQKALLCRISDYSPTPLNIEPKIWLTWILHVKTS